MTVKGADRPEVAFAAAILERLKSGGVSPKSQIALELARLELRLVELEKPGKPKP